MKEFLDRALDIAAGCGADYGDIRIVDTELEVIMVRQGEVAVLKRHRSFGFGIRLLWHGSWGFAASPDLNLIEIERITKTALEVAQASAAFRTKATVLASSPRKVAVWATPVTIEPFSISLNEKISTLLECDKLMRGVSGVVITDSGYVSISDHKYYADTEGARLEQTITHTGGGISAEAISPDFHSHRSYPTSFHGQHAAGGYEVFRSLNLIENAQRIAEESVAILSAKPCPQKETTVILSSDQMALQIHESCGHAVELDRVLGSEISDYGTSFLTLEKLNNYRYGSPLVTIVTDPTCPGGLGTFGYDDEGVEARPTTIVEAGIFKGYLTSRETAAETGLAPNASMRADGWENIPLIRMTNVNLMPGDSSLEQMIAETADGIYMITNRSWSIDDRRWNFQFGTELGYEIKNGKLGSMIRQPSYAGTTPTFWASCDAIGGPQEWTLWGVPGCGKGEPSQGARVGHGSAPARFRNVKVGVTTR